MENSQREIKFRAWDKIEEEFRPSDYIIIRGDGYIFDRETQEELHEVILMQYTGLKDKNGKDVYEGDLIKFQEYWWGDNLEKADVGEVKWGDAQWELYGKTKYQNTVWELVKNCSGEVIGNVWETPELLKV